MSFKDFLVTAGAAGVDKFAYYGYSWLGLCALQLGIRTDRLRALIMGGFPPVDGPYKEMLAVTKATYEMVKEPQKQTASAQSTENWPSTNGDWDSANDYDWDSAEVTMSADQTKQFYTLYQALKDFDDRAVQDKLNCPRLCFAGSKDIQDYSEKWGGVKVDMATPLIEKAGELKQYGWNVQVLEGLDQISAMQPTNVLPIIKFWLEQQGQSTTHGIDPRSAVLIYSKMFHSSGAGQDQSTWRS